MLGTFKYVMMRLLLVGLLSLISTMSYSQSMSIASFKLDETDLTANTKETMRYDLNNDKCALIKIETTQHNFSFDVGSIGITEVVNQNSSHPSEIWLYVPHGVKSITIQHPVFGTIRDYDFGLRVKSGKTYILKLTSEQVNTLVVDYNNSQYIVFDVYPKDAEVFINGIPFKLSETGMLETSLTFGIHNYRITAPNYHAAEGTISIHDKDQKQSLSIRLKQAFGYVDVKSPSSEFNGAKVYFDDVYVGDLPLTKFPIKSGKHDIRITKELYYPYSEKISVTDSSFTNVTPAFVPNHAMITLSSSGDDVQIFANGKLLGTGKWQGRLEEGTHIVEAKKTGYKTTIKEISLKKGEERIISLDAPTPIYGTVEITSNPINANVLIDGIEVGMTPFISSKILVGEHKIEIAKNGYKTEIETKDLLENQILRINKELTDYCNAKINANTLSEVYINGERLGYTPQQINVEAGVYDLMLKAKGYSSYSKHIRLDGSVDDINIKLKRNHVNKNEFYIQAGYNPTCLKNWNAGAGFYISNVGFEVNYLGAIGNRERLYWSDGECLPRSATYKPTGFNIKMGYGLRLNTHIRFTPQVGIQYLGFKESLEDYQASDYNAIETCVNFIDGANVTSVTVGGRLSIVILPGVGFSINPEYFTQIKESEGFDILSGVSSTIKDIPSGFNCAINLNLFF